jgi:ribose transport system substrate-binding protein
MAPFEAALAAGYKGTSVAPPATSPAPKKNVTAWIISCGQSAPGCSYVVAGAVQAANALGWKTRVFDGEFGANGLYNTGIRQAIAAHATVILPIGIDCDEARPAYLAAKAAGIPLVSINSYDCNSPLINDGSPVFTADMEYNPQTPTPAVFSQNLGKLQADWLIVQSKGKAQVVDFNLSAVTGLQEEQVGFNNELAKCSGCKILAQVSVSPPDEANGVAAKEFASTLTKYPQATAIWTSDDSLIDAANVPEAVASAGRLSTLEVLGIQGFAANLTLIRENRGQSLAVAYDPYRFGWAAMDEANRVLNGQPAVPEGIGIQIIDATHNLPAAGQNWVDPVNYKADYEKAWNAG